MGFEFVGAVAIERHWWRCRRHGRCDGWRRPRPSVMSHSVEILSLLPPPSPPPTPAPPPPPPDCVGGG